LNTAQLRRMFPWAPVLTPIRPILVMASTKALLNASLLRAGVGVEDLVGREQAHPVLQVPVVLVVEGPRRHQDRSWAAKLEFRPRGSGSCHHQKKKKGRDA
jgi:hypothetical protein